MNKYLILGATIVNDKQMFRGSILISGGRIEKIFKDNEEIDTYIYSEYEIIDASTKVLIPGVIDDQVHFRDPGLIYKGDIYTEAKAAVAGGITSYMEMPNTNPQTTNQIELKKKFERAAKVSLANFSFYMGATNDNLEELLATDPKSVCGVKIFMGSSTGNMLVDNVETLSQIFEKIKLPIATHCEDTPTIVANTEKYKELYGENIPIKCHSDIRSAEACFKSSSLAVNLAKKYNTRLHILHLSTADELELFDANTDRKEKRITAEICVHHLWFNKDDYDKLGTLIKWNPSIKEKSHQDALLKGVLSNKIDVIATDHAPHSREEKEGSYLKAMSGGPLVQHSLVAMLEMHHQGKISLEDVVDKMCHAPADIFNVKERGYIKEGFWADLTLLEMDSPWTVQKDNLLYKCKWSPFEGQKFTSKVTNTFVNGNLVYSDGIFYEETKGIALEFDR